MISTECFVHHHITILHLVCHINKRKQFSSCYKFNIDDISYEAANKGVESLIIICGGYNVCGGGGNTSMNDCIIPHQIPHLGFAFITLNITMAKK